jgi:hypothetical protein
MTTAYKPSVEVDFVLSELAFDDEEEGLEFLQRVGGVLVKRAPAIPPGTGSSGEGAGGGDEGTTTTASDLLLDTKLSSISNVAAVAQDDKLLL